MINHKVTLNSLLVLAGLIVLLGLFVMVVRGLMAAPIAPFATAFGAVIVFAGVMLGWVGLGKVRSGQAIALVCVAGAVMSGLLLAFISTGKAAGAIVRDVPSMLGVVMALGLMGIAGVDVLLRRPKESMPRLVRGLIFAVPLVILLVVVRSGPVSRGINGLEMGIQFGVYVVLLLIGIGLLSASGHQIIRAFQIGVEAADEREGKRAG
jgi:hypothetical protein